GPGRCGGGRARGRPAGGAMTVDPAALPVERVRVAVIGGGPSGLTAAAELAGHVDGEVRVIEREVLTGGVPRHSDHPGYGVGELQQIVHGRRTTVGRRAVVVGGELVSWSAVMTLRRAGCTTVAMTSTFDHAEAYLGFRVVGRLALRTTVLPTTRVISILGRSR